MSRPTLILLAFIGLLHLSQAIQRRYVTQLCPGSVGPTHGEVIMFDPNFNSAEWVIPETDIDCWMTVRGMPTTSSANPWYIELRWPTRSQFAVRGWDYANSGCDTAYIEIYQATVEGIPVGTPIIPPTCGDVAPGTITMTDQALVIHLYAEKEPVIPTTTTIATPIPVIIVTAPNTATTQSTTAATTVDTTTVATTTTAAAVTTASSSDNTTTTNNTFPAVPETGGPYITFRVDFTSYFLDCSVDGPENDGTQLQCTNNRCVDTSLQCDRYGSNNCGNFDDQLAGPPGNCSEITETTDPTEELIQDLLPLWIILGILGALIILYWCCWRPGYCPWRMARCRNFRCCRAACRPCRTGACASCCQNNCCGPAKGCYTRCAQGGCNRTKSGFPEKKPDNTDFKDANRIYGWLTFAHDDGLHVREGR